MNIEVQRGDLLEQQVTAIVHPTNALCQFATTLSKALRERGGAEIEREILDIAPVAVGAAAVTGAGRLACEHVVHVPVADEPGQRVYAENVRRAARAALLAAHRRGFDSIAMPALADEKMGVPLDAMARAVVDELRAHRNAKPQSVRIVDRSPVVVENFRLALGTR